MMAHRRLTIPIFIPMLGCSHRCVYCDQRKTSGTATMARDATVIAVAEHYLATADSSRTIKEIAFFGGTFTGLPVDYQRELLNAAAALKKSGLIQGIRISTRPDYINDHIIRFLENHGVTAVELGAQSFSDDVLSASGRGHTLSDTINATSLVKACGMELVIQLMPGLPGSDEASDMMSARQAALLRPDAVRLYPTVVIRGTPLETMYMQGCYRPLSLEDAVSLCACLCTIFSEQGIPVKRTGLHPLRPEETVNIVAGPYHPSFGFLVKSRVKRTVMERAINDALKAHPTRPACCRLILPEKEKEEYIGHRKENLSYLKNRFAFDKIMSTVGPVSDPEIAW